MSSAAVFASMLEGIKQARPDLTDAELAQRCRLARATLWRYEGGYCRNPSFESYVKIVGAYRQITGRAEPPLRLR